MPPIKTKTAVDLIPTSVDLIPTRELNLFQLVKKS